MRLLKGFHAEVGKPLLLMFENLAQCIVFPKFLEKKKRNNYFLLLNLVFVQTTLLKIYFLQLLTEFTQTLVCGDFE